MRLRKNFTKVVMTLSDRVRKRVKKLLRGGAVLVFAGTKLFFTIGAHQSFEFLNRLVF